MGDVFKFCDLPSHNIWTSQYYYSLNALQDDYHKLTLNDAGQNELEIPEFLGYSVQMGFSIKRGQNQGQNDLVVVWEKIKNNRCMLCKAIS